MQLPSLTRCSLFWMHRRVLFSSQNPLDRGMPTERLRRSCPHYGVCTQALSYMWFRMMAQMSLLELLLSLLDNPIFLFKPAMLLPLPAPECQWNINGTTTHHVQPVVECDHWSASLRNADSFRREASTHLPTMHYNSLTKGHVGFTCPSRHLNAP